MGTASVPPAGPGRGRSGGPDDRHARDDDGDADHDCRLRFKVLAHPGGEVAVARAASAAGVIQVLSTMSSIPLERVAGAGPGVRWFQLYVYRDRELTRESVRQAEAAGYSALCLTVDVPTAVVVKGVLTGEDARLAIDHGVSGIIVSNHGGRQLDAVLPTAVALPEVVAAWMGLSRCSWMEASAPAQTC